MQDSTRAVAVRGGRPRDATREEAILDVCIALVASEGYDRLTIEQVAAAAGASKATVYRRWPSKAALVVDALSRRNPAVEPIDTGSLAGDIEALGELSCGAGSAAIATLMRGVASAVSRDPELLAAFQERIAEPRRRRIEAILKRARARDELPAAVDIPFVADVLPSMLLQHLLLQGVPADRAYVLRVIDQILRPLLGLDRRGAGS